MKEARKATLSAAQKRLISTMQDINFGRIENLVIKNGEPVFNPVPVVVREIKFGGDNKPRGESALVDFALKSEVVELFKYFKSMRNGMIQCLEIKHGLPFKMDVSEEFIQ
jgi:hypothetical protein